MKKILLLQAIFFSFLLFGCTINQDGLSHSTSKIGVPSGSISSPTSTSIDSDLYGKAVYIPPPTEKFTPENFTGQWSRTNTIMALTASIKITNQKQYSFDFMFTGQYAAHSGKMQGTATIISPMKAQYSLYDTDGIATVTFELKNNLLVVTANPDNYLALGFGMNVCMGGEYTLKSPHYTNANIVNEVFKTETMKKRVKQLLGDNTYQEVVTVMQYGISYLDQPNVNHIDYSGFIDGAGEGGDIKFSGDKIYILFYDGRYTLYTNDENYKSSLPDFFSIVGHKNAQIYFVYKLV